MLLLLFAGLGGVVPPKPDPVAIPAGGSGGGRVGPAKNYKYDFSHGATKPAQKGVAEVIKKAISSNPAPSTAMAEAMKRLEALLPDLTQVQAQLDEEKRLQAQAQQALQLAQDDEDEAIATLMAMLL